MSDYVSCLLYSKIVVSHIACESFVLCSCVVVDIDRDQEFSSRLNNRSNFRGCTSLHYAVLLDSEVIVQMLLDAGQCYC